ncbi:MAG: GFA family protein [Reyranella sp.]|nr:GFA family protein [Reyranella sp.]
MSAPIAREAACCCGQLRIRTRGEPRIVSSCNCLCCQRRTGAVFGSAAFFGRGQIVATEGEASAFHRQGDSGAGLTFHFCPKCGSTVFWENERLPDIVSVAVGAFADPAFPPPVRTVWTRTKHAWVGFPEGVPHHPENPAALVPR